MTLLCETSFYMNVSKIATKSIGLSFPEKEGDDVPYAQLHYINDSHRYSADRRPIKNYLHTTCPSNVKCRPTAGLVFMRQQNSRLINGAWTATLTQSVDDDDSSTIRLHHHIHCTYVLPTHWPWQLLSTLFSLCMHAIYYPALYMLLSVPIYHQ